MGDGIGANGSDMEEEVDETFQLSLIFNREAFEFFRSTESCEMVLMSPTTRQCIGKVSFSSENENIPSSNPQIAAENMKCKVGGSLKRKRCCMQSSRCSSAKDENDSEHSSKYLSSDCHPSSPDNLTEEEHPVLLNKANLTSDVSNFEQQKSFDLSSTSLYEKSESEDNNFYSDILDLRDCENATGTLELVDQDILNLVNDATSSNLLNPAVASVLKCNLCPQSSFATKTVLNRHISSIHQASYSWPCYICGQTFKRKDSVYGHLQQVHMFKTWKCQLCLKVFKRKDRLRSHLLSSVHGKLETDIQPLLQELEPRDRQYGPSAQTPEYINNTHRNISNLTATSTSPPILPDESNFSKNDLTPMQSCQNATSLTSTV